MEAWCARKDNDGTMQAFTDTPFTFLDYNLDSHIVLVYIVNIEVLGPHVRDVGEI